MAVRYSFPFGVSRSKRTWKKFRSTWSTITDVAAVAATAVMGDVSAAFPEVIPPLLEEVGVPVRCPHHHIERVVSENDAVGLGRDGQRSAGVVGGQRPDDGELEEPFGVGLGVAG